MHAASHGGLCTLARALALGPRALLWALCSARARPQRSTQHSTTVQCVPSPSARGGVGVTLLPAGSSSRRRRAEDRWVCCHYY
jgi:hypothetical protein